MTGESWSSENIVISTNDIASTREITCQGAGWALLPLYAVDKELKNGRLKLILDHQFEQEKYGVWKLRTRQHLATHFLNACEWFKLLQC